MTKLNPIMGFLSRFFTPKMVGLYYKVTGKEFKAHILKRIASLEAYGERINGSGIILAPKQQEVYGYAIACYKFALTHIDFSYTYFLDESEIGTWEFIRTMDTFDQLDYGKPAVPTPSKIVKPHFGVH